MGKGRIVEAVGDGLYKIIVERDVAAVKQRIAELKNNILDWMTNRLPSAETEAQRALYELNRLADNLELQSGITLQEQLRIESERLELALKYQEKRAVVTQLEADIVAMRVDLSRLERAAADEAPVDAWCADYSTSLSGEIGTIEVPGERNGVPVLIQPGHEGGATYSGKRDGKIQPVEAGTPEQVFWNWAMLPAWQKWRPNYRIATITEIDGDTCAIQLDTAKSSQQLINVNETSEYTGVQIEYMTCNGAVFEVDDRVVVEFFDEEDKVLRQPRVVGFEKEPKPCGGSYYAIELDNELPAGYGTPQPQSFIVSFGGENGFRSNAPSRYLYGNVDWRGLAGVVSWHGPESRYWYENIQESGTNTYYPGQVIYSKRAGKYDGAAITTTLSNKIYRNGALLATAPSLVLGACVVNREDGKFFVCAVVASGYDHLLVLAKSETIETWVTLDTLTYPDYSGDLDFAERAPYNTWCFSESGQKAVSVQYQYNDQTAVIETVLVSAQIAYSEDASAGSFSKQVCSNQSAQRSQTSVLSEYVDVNEHTWSNPGSFLRINYSSSATRFDSVASYSLAHADILAADYVGENLVYLKATVAGSGSGSQIATMALLPHEYTFAATSYVSSVLGKRNNDILESKTTTTRVFWDGPDGATTLYQNSYVIDYTHTDADTGQGYRVPPDGGSTITAQTLGVQEDSDYYGEIVGTDSRRVITAKSNKFLLYADCRTKTAIVEEYLFKALSTTLPYDESAFDKSSEYLDARSSYDWSVQLGSGQMKTYSVYCRGNVIGRIMLDNAGQTSVENGLPVESPIDTGSFTESYVNQQFLDGLFHSACIANFTINFHRNFGILAKSFTAQPIKMSDSETTSANETMHYLTRSFYYKAPSISAASNHVVDESVVSCLALTAENKKAVFSYHMRNGADSTIDPTNAFQMDKTKQPFFTTLSPAE